MCEGHVSKEKQKRGKGALGCCRIPSEQQAVCQHSSEPERLVERVIQPCLLPKLYPWGNWGRREHSGGKGVEDAAMVAGDKAAAYGAAAWPVCAVHPLLPALGLVGVVPPPQRQWW